MLDTDGTNLLEVLGHPDVDHTTTFSNDIVEICDTLGIEAGNVENIVFSSFENFILYRLCHYVTILVVIIVKE